MHPFLFQIGPLALPSYGAAIAAGFFLAVLLAARGGRRIGIGADKILDLSFWLVLATFLGSRLMYVLTNADLYLAICRGDEAEGPRSAGQIAWDCSRWLHLWDGGYVFYGGLLAIAATVAWYGRRHQIPLLKLGDLGAPSLALSHFFGRLGCLAAGCCYGKACASPWGLRFPPRSLAFRELVLAGTLQAGAAATPPLHPTQLYEAGAELLIFVALLLLGRFRRRYGQVLAAYLLLYPPARAIIELFRGDPARRYLVKLATPGLNRALGLPPNQPSLLSTSQVVSGLLFGLGAALLAWLRRPVPPAGSPPERPQTPR